MNRKGQSAMEFLMTYGWAILVVLIAIGALAYFGILNPARFLPSSCTLFPGMACNSFKIGTTSANFVVQNGLGVALTLVNLTISDPSQGSCDWNTGAGYPGTIASTGVGVSLSDGQTLLMTMTCAAGSFGTAGDRFKADVNISYGEGTGSNIIYHTKRGSVAGQIE